MKDEKVDEEAAFLLQSSLDFEQWTWETIGVFDMLGEDISSRCKFMKFALWK